MRLAMILATPLILLAAPLAVLTGAKSSEQNSWYDVMDHRLVIASGDDRAITLAVDETMRKFRMPAEHPLDINKACEYDAELQVWFNEDESGKTLDKAARRQVREQIDQEGHALRIVQVESGSETLVFIEHDVPAEESPIAEEIGKRLANSGYMHR